MAPIVHGLEQRYYGRIDFVYLDIDDPRTGRFKQQLGYRYQPEFFLLNGDGNVVGRWIGFAAEETLSAAFDSYLATVP